MGNLTLKKFFSDNVREVSLILVIIVISIFVQIRSGSSFFTMENISDLLTETAILAILAVGMMMVIITAGIDLSIGAVMALAGMIGTSVLKENKSINPIFIILIAVAVGIVCGMINGTLVSRLKILPIIATLGMMNVFRGLTYLVSKGSWILQNDMPSSFLGIATGRVVGINNLVIMAIFIYVIGYIFLNYSRTGRKIYAVGNSEESAKVSGIKTERTLWLAYTIMGAIAGFAGLLYVCKFGAAQGETAVGYEMNVIAACVLGGVSISGGTGRIQGVLLGALLLGLLNNAMPLINISAFWQEAIRGLIILLSVMSNALIQRNVEMKVLRRRSI
ncbi:ABC transporter permease [Clostridium intestinale]|uniref:ABC transporter permease n=1 Tax=Clostridium intestinale TaxID=36845 RepID=UPI0028E98D52|nr:ABC transporter permease [Clostridium intestinale]